MWDKELYKQIDLQKVWIALITKWANALQNLQ